MSEKQRTPKELKAELRARAKELKPVLPKGFAEIVEKETGKSRTFIYDVMSGRRWDLQVIEELIKVGKNHLKRVEKGIADLDKIKRKMTQK